MAREETREVPPLPAEARGEAPGRARLEGRRILVVGAGTRASDEPEPPIGNGRAIAILAAREGARVACADVDETAARETSSQIEKEGGSGCVLVADVSDPASCERVVSTRRSTTGTAPSR
jgi:NAD(P)-dependent dehydrogenase (short-subunit alcohol dehydrogenase family)